MLAVDCFFGRAPGLGVYGFVEFYLFFFNFFKFYICFRIRPIPMNMFSLCKKSSQKGEGDVLKGMVGVIF